MAPIDSSLFSGEDRIDREELAHLEVANTKEAVEAALKHFSWGGKAAGCIVLQLAADNLTVTSGRFTARGKLAKEEVKIEASKIWADVDAGLHLTLKIPDGGDFIFNEGGLCSDFLDMEGVDYCVTTSSRGGQAVLHDDYSQRGVGSFCIRLVCHLQKATKKSGVTLGYAVLLYPGTANDVLETSDLAKNPSWPGLKMAEGEMAMLPNPRVAWRCPLLPLLMTGTPWEDDIITPPMEELRQKIAWIMHTSEPADHCKTRKALMGKWDKYSTNPDEFVTKRSPLSWPKPRLARITGRNILKSCLCSLLAINLLSILNPAKVYCIITVPCSNKCRKFSHTS
jgi:hypothetical protein